MNSQFGNITEVLILQTCDNLSTRKCVHMKSKPNLETYSHFYLMANGMILALFFRYVQKFAQNDENVQNFGHNRPYFQKKSKIKKFVPTVCRGHIEVPLGQISAF